MRAVKHKIIWVMLIIFVITGCASIEKAESLHRQGEKQEALDMAISLLEDDSSKVRLRAVKLIGKIGGSEAGPALHQRLGESDDRVTDLGRNPLADNDCYQNDQKNHRNLSPG